MAGPKKDPCSAPVPLGWVLGAGVEGEALSAHFWASSQGKEPVEPTGSPLPSRSFFRYPRPWMLVCNLCRPPPQSQPVLPLPELKAGGVQSACACRLGITRVLLKLFTAEGGAGDGKGRRAAWGQGLGGKRQFPPCAAPRSTPGSLRNGQLSPAF